MFEMIAEVEFLFDLGIAQRLLHIGIGFEEGEEITFAAPDRHRIALHEPIGIFA